MLLAPFLQQCKHQPDALALSENGRSLTFRQLLQQASVIAGNLQQRGVKSNQTVALHLDRGIDATCAVFGILLAGACYVPLDLKNPSVRLSFIVEDATVVVVLGLGVAPTWLNAELWLDIAACHESKVIPVTIKAGDLAAILYTSGSTGQPRGVVLSHNAVATFALWAAKRLDLQEKDRIASSSPFFFDLSTFDLYAVLGQGASLHFIPATLTLFPARLSAWLKEQFISGWYTVPSLLSFLVYKGNLAQTHLESLRFLLFAGEIFPTPHLMDLVARLPHVALYNFFGPTETNVCCYWLVEQSQLVANCPIPIGVAAAASELYIAEETGELWVQGLGLASGYWQKGEVLPFLNSQGWYQTGDRVSLINGEYHFHGRLGRMLKCSGYRVEPAEIEATVHGMSGVRACAVVGINDPATGQRPALALVLESGATVNAIRKALLQQLPPYMQPKHCIELLELPHLGNGKLDYYQLQNLLEVAPL